MKKSSVGYAGGAAVLALILAVTGCSHKPSGVYLSQSRADPQVCLDFRTKGKVIFRDLSRDLSGAFVAESDYIVHKDVLVIKAFNLFGVKGSYELSIDGDTLVAANGMRFVKDTSGRTYTPLERANEAAKAQAQTEKEKAEREKAQIEADRVATEARRKREEANARQQEEERQLAIARQAEIVNAARAKSEAAEKAKEAKVAAIASLPTFTNQIVTIVPLQGEVCSNIAVVRASLDGIVYTVPDSASGGCISYTNLSLDDFTRFGVDTNLIAVAQERAVVRSQADAYYRAIAAQQGAQAAAAFQADWQKWWQQQQKSSPLAYAPGAAFAARYGITPHQGSVNFPIGRRR